MFFSACCSAGRGTAMFVGKGKLRHIAKPDTAGYFDVQGAADQVAAAAADGAR